MPTSHTCVGLLPRNDGVWPQTQSCFIRFRRNCPHTNEPLMPGIANVPTDRGCCSHCGLPRLQARRWVILIAPPWTPFAMRLIAHDVQRERAKALVIRWWVGLSSLRDFIKHTLEYPKIMTSVVKAFPLPFRLQAYGSYKAWYLA